MSAALPPPLSARDRLIWRRCRVVGWIVLIGGLLAAVTVFFRAGSEDDDGDIIGYEDGFPIHARDSKRFQLESERMYGKSGQIATDLREWFVGLWHGRRLAYTLAVLSVAGGVFCFYLADFLTFPLPPEHRATAAPTGPPAQQ